MKFSAITSGTNFLGTSNNASLVVRTNNVQRVLPDRLGNPKSLVGNFTFLLIPDNFARAI